MNYTNCDADRHCESQAKQSGDVNIGTLINNKAAGLPRYARNDAPTKKRLKTEKSSVNHYLLERL